jgi:hypothetical protein
LINDICFETMFVPPGMEDIRGYRINKPRIVCRSPYQTIYEAMIMMINRTNRIFNPQW